MSKVPSIDFVQVVHALHMKLTVPAHRPIKRSTLSHILKQARLSVNAFLRLL